MKLITIVVPNGLKNASSITTLFEVLDFANEYWQNAGNKAMFDIRLAGCGEILELRIGHLSVPFKIHEIKKTDLLIIPSISRDYNLVH